MLPITQSLVSEMEGVIFVSDECILDLVPRMDSNESTMDFLWMFSLIELGSIFSGDLYTFLGIKGDHIRQIIVSRRYARHLVLVQDSRYSYGEGQVLLQWLAEEMALHLGGVLLHGVRMAIGNRKRPLYSDMNTESLTRVLDRHFLLLIFQHRSTLRDRWERLKAETPTSFIFPHQEKIRPKLREKQGNAIELGKDMPA